jgi:hypothetical protein
MRALSHASAIDCPFPKFVLTIGRSHLLALMILIGPVRATTIRPRGVRPKHVIKKGKIPVLLDGDAAGQLLDSTDVSTILGLRSTRCGTGGYSAVSPSFIWRILRPDARTSFASKSWLGQQIALLPARSSRHT